MRDVVYLARNDLRFMLRSRPTILWVFVMPIAFFYFIGSTTSGFSGPGAARPPALALDVAPGAGFLVDELAGRLGEAGFAVVRSDTGAVDERIVRRLRVPAGFTDSVLAGTPATLESRIGDPGLTADRDAMRLRRGVYTVLADLAAVSERAAEPTPAAFRALAEMPRRLTLEVSSGGERPIIPTGFQQAIPGILVMFTLLVMATSGAILLVIEREQGLLRRLASAPIPRRHVVAGKWLGKLLLGFVQIAFGMLTGTILFGMDWGRALPMVIVLMAVYAGMMAALGLVLGSIARSPAQASAIGVITANVFAALGGCWWPIEVAPRWMQALQLVFPTGWAMDALHRLIAFGHGPLSVLPHVVAMALAAVLLLVLGARVFRYQ